MRPVQRKHGSRQTSAGSQHPIAVPVTGVQGNGCRAGPSRREPIEVGETCSKVSPRHGGFDVHATHAYVTPNGGSERLVERMVYGEWVSDAVVRNLRGRMFRVYDGAGAATQERFDFKGNLLEASRRLRVTVDAEEDWTSLAAATDLAGVEVAAASLLEGETFSITTTYDALDRVVTSTTPDSSEVQLGYNETALLETVDVRLRGAATPTSFVSNIDYNARGQQTAIAYGNGTSTTYTYDPETFRLAGLVTTRTSDSATLQDLRYHYDPVGNVAEVRDESQDDVFFQNTVVEAHQQFVVDLRCTDSSRAPAASMRCGPTSGMRTSSPCRRCRRTAKLSATTDRSTATTRWATS